GGVLASYHNHTTWSDGKTSVDGLVAGARDLGLAEVGISDHLTLHPTRRDVSWSMPAENVDGYARDVLAAAERSRSRGGPTVRLGLEADWFASRAETLRSTLASLPMDFVIGSVHFHGDVELDGHASVWERGSVDERERVHRDYWMRIRELADSGLFDIVGHLDLTKKFAFSPRDDISDAVTETLDAIADAALVVELNTNGWHCPCREAYPAPAILHECRRRDIPVTISADAHEPAHLLRDFAAASGVLREAGYDRVARFANRHLTFDSIDSATPADR
ncbi:MAG: histidinol-phosphatase HisJ family protein, partial [Planctomycetota bacterium]